MRINQSKRIFMNEADSSPGNGAPVATPTPAAPTAAPTAPETPASLTAESVATIVATAVDAKLKAFENGLFANARKAGLLKKDEPATPAPTPSASTPAPTGLSMADVEAMLERERVITRVATEHKLSDAQVKRMKGLLTAERPEDVSGWVSSFMADMGLARANNEPSNPITQIPQPQPNGQPISDKGSPAPGGVVNWEREYAENPLGMSAAARAAMDAKHGAEKARKMRVDAAQAQLSRIKVITRPQV